jgi:hypothetical protein
LPRLELRKINFWSANRHVTPFMEAVDLNTAVIATSPVGLQPVGNTNRASRRNIWNPVPLIRSSRARNNVIWTLAICLSSSIVAAFSLPSLCTVFTTKDLNAGLLTIQNMNESIKWMYVLIRLVTIVFKLQPPWYTDMCLLIVRAILIILLWNTVLREPCPSAKTAGLNTYHHLLWSCFFWNMGHTVRFITLKSGEFCIIIIIISSSNSSSSSSNSSSSSKEYYSYTSSSSSSSSSIRVLLVVIRVVVV